MYNIIGIKVIDYTNKQNRRVVGKELHVTFLQDNIDGVGVEKLYIPDKLPCNVKIGDDIDVYYDKYGSIIAINLIERK